MRKNFNNKIIGKDVMELSDIEALTAEDMKKYRIAVMQMELKGYTFEYFHWFDMVWRISEYPLWNWDKTHYRVVPKVELTPEQKLQNWIKETGAKVGDTIRDKNGNTGVIDKMDKGIVRVFAPGDTVPTSYYHCDLELIKPTYAELQAQWVKENDVKVGNTVKVLRGFKNGEFGGHVNWYDVNKYVVGTIYKIYRIQTDCIIIQDDDNDELGFPFQVLELIRPEIKAYTFEDFCRLEMQWKQVKRIIDNAIGFVEYIKSYEEDDEPIRIQFENKKNYYTLSQFKDEFVWLNGEPCGVTV